MYPGAHVFYLIIYPHNCLIFYFYCLVLIHICCFFLEESVFLPTTIHFSFATVLHFLASCYISLVLLNLFFQDSTRGCRAKVWRRTRNIPAQLCFAPDDSQHYRSHGVDASLILYPIWEVLSDFSLSVSI